ncbi:MAG: SWI/SNF chromatin-remodeling complex subunit [Claussenomyces sp. TS43310]|nr:MAG: SWI/SNF chromatin-remodeling complex subunit [Claussenomyces sp. TS43310]
MAPEPPQSSPGASTTATIATVAIPHRQRASFDKLLLDQYVTRDWLHTAALAEQNDREKKLLDQKVAELEDYRNVRGQYRQWFPPSRLYGEGYNGYGNGHTDGKPGLLYPVNKPRLGRRSTPALKIKRKDMTQQADQVEELVPVRLDIDWEKIKLRDTFTWNLHDRVVPMKLFAEQLVEDFGLDAPASDRVLEQVMAQLYEQLGDFFPPVYFEEDELDPELPYSAYKNDEMRILIKLNITIGPHTLVDQFEWEINNPLNSPEEFAQSMARDLALSGEFTTAIAHCIREQSQLFTRSLYIIGHPFDGRPVEDADLVASFLPSPIPSAFRPQQQAKDYAPYLYELSEAELERNEVIFSREQRRQKRSVNRRGGPTLPDLKDRQRTVRTLVVSSVLPGAAESVDESRIYKRISGASGRSKRGATGLKDGFENSESEESDESGPDSPALSQLQGTARTRGMRGAATAAQQRMANLGRSETPEAATLHHHETRTSARRFGGRDAREESVEGNPSLIIKLSISKEKLRQFLRERRGGVIRPPASLTHHRSQSTVSGHGTPATAGSMGPPVTPGLPNQSLGAAFTTPTPGKAPAGQIGRIVAPPPPAPGQVAPPLPPPPSWLSTGLSELQRSYPHDRFEGVMRYSAIDKLTDAALTMPAPGTPVPNNMKFMYLPRIRCHDCPGKLYTPGPGMTVENFEVHLRNRLHREKVDARAAAARRSGA